MPLCCALTWADWGNVLGVVRNVVPPPMVDLCLFRRLGAIVSLGALLALAGCSSPQTGGTRDLGKMPEVVTTAQPEWIPWGIRAGKSLDADPRERHLAELRQLTFGGDNAEAYWSP